MPKATFFNLADDKREAIIDITVEEFAGHDYKTASLSRIVEKAGIAKGSMYQYFASKQELYLYVIEVASEKKLKYLTEHMNLATEDFFALCREMTLIGSRFNLTYPKYSRLLYHAVREGSGSETGDLSRKLMKMAREQMINLMAPYLKKGQISDRVSLDLAAYCLTQLSIGLEDYIAELFDFSYEELLKEGSAELPVPQDKLEEIIDELMEFFKHGIQARS